MTPEPVLWGMHSIGRIIRQSAQKFWASTWRTTWLHSDETDLPFHNAPCMSPVATMCTHPEVPMLQHHRQLSPQPAIMSLTQKVVFSRSERREDHIKILAGRLGNAQASDDFGPQASTVADAAGR